MDLVLHAASLQAWRSQVDLFEPACLLAPQSKVAPFSNGRRCVKKRARGPCGGRSVAGKWENGREIAQADVCEIRAHV